jgi:hypothetical protein
MPIDKPMDPLFNQDDFEIGPGGFTTVDNDVPSDESMLTEMEDGGMLVDFDPEGLSVNGDDSSFESNLTEYIEDGELNSIALDLVSKFDSDKSSRSNWEQTYEEGLDYLGLEIEDRTTPWAGACGVFHPMLSEAVVRFQSQTIQEIMPAQGPVKTQIWGKFSPERDKQAKRVQQYLNYQ